MLTHVVLIGLKEGVADTDLQAAIDGYVALPDDIPEMRSADAGRDAGLSPNSADLALVSTFDSADDFLTYREHPAHQTYAQERVMPIATTFTVIQYETSRRPDRPEEATPWASSPENRPPAASA